MDTLILIVIGGIAGVMSGLFGIGGGAIIVPALIVFSGFTQFEANGTSLAALLLPVGAFACIEYYRAGKLRIRPALAVALGLGTGVWFGANIALQLDADLLKQSYGLFLLFLAWRYIAPLELWRSFRSHQPVDKPVDNEIDADRPSIIAACFAIGIGAGVMSGLFGIGGGVVIVPMLMILLRFDQKLANGTSLGALLLPVGLPGVLRYAQAEQLDIASAVPLAIMLLLGALVGARLAFNLPTRTVRRLYGVFLLVIGLRFLFFG